MTGCAPSLRTKPQGPRAGDHRVALGLTVVTAAFGPREMVLRRIDAGTYLRRLLVRQCQSTPSAACDPACFSRPVDPS
ncbi:MAG: hypothetical protein U0326_17140 [Polyangiales bacterium]